jgi:hypothetical protein
MPRRKCLQPQLRLLPSGEGWVLWTCCWSPGAPVSPCPSPQPVSHRLRLDLQLAPCQPLRPGPSVACLWPASESPALDLMPGI